MKANSILKSKPSTCPYCKAEENHIDYTNTIRESEYIIYRAKCLKCGCIFEELYVEQYVETEIVEEGKTDA